MLDCKKDAKVTESAPNSLDYLCDECRAHFDTVKELLAAAGVAYVVNPRMVRGLDYYTRTAFEVMAGGLGAQSTVVAGGRYDGLVEAMGGAPVAGIGFAIGVDRMALALQAAGVTAERRARRRDNRDGSRRRRVMRSSLARDLRAANLNVEMLSPERKMKTLLARASKIGARFAVIIGDDELARGVVQLRDLKQSTQREVTVADAARAIADATTEL